MKLPPTMADAIRNTVAVARLTAVLTDAVRFASNRCNSERVMSSITRAVILVHSAALAASDILGSRSVVMGQPLRATGSRNYVATPARRLLIQLVINHIDSRSACDVSLEIWKPERHKPYRSIRTAGMNTALGQRQRRKCRIYYSPHFLRSAQLR